MDLLHKGIVAVVAAAVAGGAAWTAYDLYIRPKRALALEQRRVEREAAVRAAEKVRDPSQEAYAAAAKLGDGPEARQAWKDFLQKFPASPKAPEVRVKLGPANIADFFSATETEWKESHTVAKGDSLFKISKLHGTSIELIARANGLTNTMLQIGQQLVLPKPDLKVTIDRASKELILENRGEFLVSYAMKSAQVPGLPEGKPASCSVAETLVDADGKRVVFGDKRYAAGRRIVTLSPPGGAITSSPEATTNPPAGLALSEPDMAEIFVLLRRGVPVTIK